MAIDQLKGVRLEYHFPINEPKQNIRAIVRSLHQLRTILPRFPLPRSHPVCPIMYSSAFILMSVLASCAAFSPAPSFSSRAIAFSNPLHMTVKAPIVITGDNIDLTPALSDYVNQKIERTLGKLPTAVSHCDVYLSVNKNPKVSGDNVSSEWLLSYINIYSSRGLCCIYCVLSLLYRL